MTLMVGPSTHHCIMKTFLQRYILVVCLAGTAITAPAGLYSSWPGTGTSTQTIPDNNGSGLAYSFNLTQVSRVKRTANVNAAF